MVELENQILKMAIINVFLFDYWPLFVNLKKNEKNRKIQMITKFYNILYNVNLKLTKQIVQAQF